MLKVTRGGERMLIVNFRGCELQRKSWAGWGYTMLRKTFGMMHKLIMSRKLVGKQSQSGHAMTSYLVMLVLVIPNVPNVC